MKYLIFSFKSFIDKYFDILVTSQKDFYPNEPEAKYEDVLPYCTNSYVIAALDECTVAGYSAFTLYKSSRNDSFFGSNLYLYVFPEYRKTSVGGRLIKNTEEFCLTRGCTEFKWDIAVNSPMIPIMEKRKEYKLESFVYSRKLK